MKRRGLFRFLGLGAVGAVAVVGAGTAQAAPAPEDSVGAPSGHPFGTIGWARDQVLAGHRVRQRCWKNGQACEAPEEMVRVFGYRYEEGIDSLKGLPLMPDMLWGSDWEIVSKT